MIARRLPGRTDNEIKNYWRTHLRKKALIQEQGAVQFPFFLLIPLVLALPTSANNFISFQQKIFNLEETMANNFSCFKKMVAVPKITMVKATSLVRIFWIQKTVVMMSLGCQISLLQAHHIKRGYQIGYQSFQVIKVK